MQRGELSQRLHEAAAAGSAAALTAQLALVRTQKAELKRAMYEVGGYRIRQGEPGAGVLEGQGYSRVP